MARFLNVSPGADIPGRTRIAERSTIKLRDDAEERQIEAEERQAERAEETRIRAEKRAGETADTSYLRQLESESDELNLNLPYKRTTSRVTAPAFSPLAERIKAEQGYQRLSTGDKIRYLEDRVRPAIKERGRNELEEEAGLYGITPEQLRGFEPKTQRTIIDEAKKDFGVKEKERKELIKSQEKGKKIIEWMDSVVKMPDRDNVFTDGATGIKYGLNTITEARRKFVERLKRQPSPTEEEMLAKIPWPPDGVDEVAVAKAGKTDEQEIEHAGKLAEAKRAPEKARSRQEQAFEAVKKGETLPGFTAEETKKLAIGSWGQDEEEGKSYFGTIPKERPENIDEATWIIMRNIKAQEDLYELLEARANDEPVTRNIDVNAIINWFNENNKR